MQVKDTFFVVNNFNNDTSWIKEYTDNYVIYNKGVPIDDPKAIQTPNVGYNIYDYLTYIIDNYDNLPVRVAFLKSNVFPRHMTKEEFDAKIHNTEFTPLHSMDHHTRLPVSFYDESGNYNERNDSWYLMQIPSIYFRDYGEFAKQFGLPSPEYLTFSPGANYIVPKQNILKHPVDFYRRLRSLLTYTSLASESHLIERAMYTIFK